MLGLAPVDKPWVAAGGGGWELTERGPKVLGPGAAEWSGPGNREPCTEEPLIGASFWGIVLQAPPIVMALFEVHGHALVRSPFQGFGSRSTGGGGFVWCSLIVIVNPHL